MNTPELSKRSRPRLGWITEEARFQKSLVSLVAAVASAGNQLKPDAGVVPAKAAVVKKPAQER